MTPSPHEPSYSPSVPITDVHHQTINLSRLLRIIPFQADRNANSNAKRSVENGTAIYLSGVLASMGSSANDLLGGKSVFLNGYLKGGGDGLGTGLKKTGTMFWSDGVMEV